MINFNNKSKWKCITDDLVAHISYDCIGIHLLDEDVLAIPLSLAL